MEITAKILDIVKTYDDVQILTVKLDNAKTKEQCTIREGEDYAVNCAGSCEACTACCSGNSVGLFALSGDTVNAINTSGIKLKKGDFVLLDVPKKEQGLQFLISVLLPTILAVLGFVLFWHFFQTELLGILGIALGIALAVFISFFVNKIRGNKKLPKVKSVLQV